MHEIHEELQKLKKKVSDLENKQKTVLGVALPEESTFVHLSHQHVESCVLITKTESTKHFVEGLKTEMTEHQFVFLTSLCWIQAICLLRMLFPSVVRYEERAPDSSRGDKNICEPDPQKTEEWVLTNDKWTQRLFWFVYSKYYLSIIFPQVLNLRRERTMENTYP